MKNNYIIISSIDWKTSWQTQHRLAKSLISDGNKVLFIENTGLRNIKLKDKTRILSRLKSWKNSTKGFNEVEKNLFVYSPIVFPMPYNNLVSKFNANKIFNNIKKWMDTVYYKDPIVISFLPTILNNQLINNLKPSLYIYYAANDFGTQKGTEKILKSEIDTINKAQISFATSHQILDKISKFSTKSYFFPAAIEEKKFSNINGRKPKILNELKKPIVGYLGNFTDVFDIKLMIDLISTSPEITFIFIGNLNFYDERFKQLKNFKNCTFVGEIDNNLVPLYLKYIDIGIIPYYVNDFTNGVYCSKLNEYLALGLPVISTKFREMNIIKNKNDDLIYLIDNDHLDFKNKIKLALSEKDKLKESRINYAFKNSWDKKFIEIKKIIYSYLTFRIDVQNDWKKNYLKNFKNYTRRVAIVLFVTYLILFQSPLINILGSTLIVNNNYNPSSKVIFVMSGYGSDNYFNNSYLMMAKKVSNLIEEDKEKDLRIIVSGRFQVYPESQIIKKILITSGFRNDTIITLDTEYKNTKENLKLFFDIANKNKMDMKSEFTILTSPFHSKRTRLILNKSFSEYNTNVIISDKLEINHLAKIKIIFYEFFSIIYNLLKGNI
jgi:teichuronic acid biosynthesis glycosyltransferase TuaH